MKLADLVVVDDDDVAIEIFAMCLEKAHVDVPCRTAANGLEALELLTEPPASPVGSAVSLIVLDLKMPVMDGFDFLRARARDPAMSAMPVFVYSSSTDPGTVQQAYDLGCTAYFPKAQTMAEGCDFAAMLGNYISQCEVARPPNGAANG